MRAKEIKGRLRLDNMKKENVKFYKAKELRELSSTTEVLNNKNEDEEEADRLISRLKTLENKARAQIK